MANRREKVTLELDDNGFSTQLAKDAAAVMLLERALKSLDGTSVDIHQRLSESAVQVDNLSRSSRDADTSINQLTGRLRVLGEVAAVLAPALAPLGGVALAGIAGLTSQIGFAAVAGGVLIGSLQGVGGALEAMNKAQLDPSVKNLEKAEEALKALSPAARDFANEAFALKPALIAIRDIGAEELLPGLTESLDNLERLGPKVGGIFEAVAGALGDIAADSTASLTSERWEGFFQFIRDEAPDAIRELATTVGSLTHGMVELWEAFTPLNDDFSSWLMNVAGGFDAWATGLDQTQGFQEFVEYIRTTGPQVADTVGALANMLIQVVQASAPLGGPVLAGIEAVANAIAAIADSDLGTPIMVVVGALALLNRTLAVTASLSKVSLSSGLFAGVGTLMAGAKGGAGANTPLGQLQAMPGALREATAAQQALVAAQKQASAAAAQYVGQLQAVNSAQARGFKPSMQSLDRLTDSLDQVELANRDVEVATQRAAEAEEKRRSTLRGSAAQLGKTAGLVGSLALLSSGAADSIGLTNTMSLALAGSMAGPLGAALGTGAGLLLDLKSAGEGATTAIDGLAATAQSGNITALKDQIAAAKTELADINNLDVTSPSDILGRIGFQVADTFGGTSADEAKKKIDDAKKAVEELTKAEELRELQARASVMTYASQVGLNTDLATWSRRSTEEIKAQADALAALNDEADGISSSFLKFPDSLNKAKVSLGDFITDMQNTANALANFNTNSLKAAKNGLDEGLIASLRKMGPEGALRMKQFANASVGEIRRANKAFQSHQAEIERTREVTRDLAGMSPVAIKVNTETAGAMNDIAGLEARLRAIKDEDVFINVRQIGSTTLGPRNEAADGATVRDAPGPYRDQFLYALAPREEVISNRRGQADRYRGALKAINADMPRHIIRGMLADGGTAGDDDDKKDGKKKRETLHQTAFASSREIQRVLREFGTLAKAIRKTEKAYDTQSEVLNNANSAVEATRSAMASLAESTTRFFMNDLFRERPGSEADPAWRAGAKGAIDPSTDPVGALLADIAYGTERDSLQQQLIAAGLGGKTAEEQAALETVLRQGDNAALQAMLANGQVQQVEDLLIQRGKLAGDVGGDAASAVYGRKLEVQLHEQQLATAELRAMNHELKWLEKTHALLEKIREEAADNAEKAGAGAATAVVKGGNDAARRKRRDKGGDRR